MQIQRMAAYVANATVLKSMYTGTKYVSIAHGVWDV